MEKLDPQPESFRRCLLGFLYIPLVVIPFYILSTGPAAKLGDTYLSTLPVMRAVYSPIVILAERSNLVADWLNWYGSVCGVRHVPSHSSG
jgi:hypothetical protein